MRSVILSLLSIAALSLTATATPSMTPHITGIKPITLHPGVNRVAEYLPGGGTATIVEAWRGNGNAHGYHSWMVLTGSSEGNPVGLAPLDDGVTVSDTIRDNPFDGEREIGAVRFAHAVVDGRPASLIVTAHLDWTAGRPLADHELATIAVYRLTTNDGIGSPLSFARIATLRSARRYCNAELALRDMLGVALPASYAGANRIDGCFSG